MLLFVDGSGLVVPHFDGPKAHVQAKRDLLQGVRGLFRTSSAAAERVFSILKRLVDVLGKSALADEVETRMMLVTNPQDAKDVYGVV